MGFPNALRRYFEAVDSTNDELARWLKRRQIPEGSCVVAEFQTNGKGQRNSTWHSETGQNLMCSFILYPKTQAEFGIFYFSKAMACAVRDTVADCGCSDVKIKWPNDVLIGRKKAAGILIENQWTAQGWISAILGMGINVNQRNFEGLTATSISENSSKSWSSKEVLSLLEQHIHHYYRLFQSEKFEDINANYHSHLFGLNTIESFETANDVFAGKIMGVDPCGLLEIQLESGNVQAFQLKEAKLLL
jgi:BirA family biotin operon repressor/biotin-[acetyl-CoA-carboxylase] ligase